MGDDKNMCTTKKNPVEKDTFWPEQGEFYNWMANLLHKKFN